MSIHYQNRDENFTVKISKDNSFPLHLHREVEIFFVLDGELEMTIGNQTFLLQKNMLSVSFPNIAHQTFTPVHSTSLMLIFEPELLPDFYTDLSSFRPEFPFLTEISYDSPAFFSLSELTKSASFHQDDRLLKGFLSILLCSLFEHFRLLPVQLEEMDLCQKIADYMHHHYTESISLTQLAQSLGYSKFHISHVLNDSFGCSFNTYLNQLRAEYAMGLLTHSDISVTDACYASGFNSIRTFYRVFGQVYGKTPGEIK